MDDEHAAPADAAGGTVTGPPRPTRGTLAAAFVAIVVAGLAGAVIGAGLVSISCRGSCTTATGVAAVVGGVVGAGGVGIVVVLVLRAMSEWRRIDTTQPGGATGSG